MFLANILSCSRSRRATRRLRLIVLAVLAPLVTPAARLASQQPSPENQIFQFMATASRSDWNDGAKTSATAYLWIPEKTQHVRGLLVMGSNVPENRLVGNPNIRATAAANDLAIVWSTPSFWYFRAKNEDTKVVGLLQQLLDQLAAVSGYQEVATAPWIPIGESGHLLMVDALTEAAPDRCIASIWLKNPHLPPHNRTVPALVIFGTAQEWGQDKADYEQRWKDTGFYTNVLNQRKSNPSWPLTFLIDGTSGHFDVSPRLTRYVAHYIDTIVKLRLSTDASPKLRPIDLREGYLADLPLPSQTKSAPIIYAAATAESQPWPWFPDKSSAEDAQSIASINWQAASQLPAFADKNGKVYPFDLNGISSMVPHMDADGITFHLQPVLLNTQPTNFVHAGAALQKGPMAPSLEWLCGAVAPRADGALQVSLDRTWPQQAIYYAARSAGSDTVRAAVQPIHITLKPNSDGLHQTISFDALKNVKLGARSVPLHAISDSRLPVRFFVVAGPAYIQGDQLILTPLPPRTRYPVTVTVAAWQWGRDAEPKVKTADILRRQFLIER